MHGGLPVPDGFVITTEAYRRLVEDAALGTPAHEAAEAAGADDPAAVEAASAVMRRRFAEASVPEEIKAAVRQGYRNLGSPAVAVRSKPE